MRSHNTLVEGIVTGGLGAAAVAGWFLVVDSIAGAPFRTPMALGAALFGGVVPAPGDVDVGLLASYTLFHFTAFVLVGLLAAASTHLVESQPVVLGLFTILFVVFEMGFYGMIAMLHATELLGGLTWYQIGFGNLLASAVMGSFLWQTHPRIREGFGFALGR